MPHPHNECQHASATCTDKCHTHTMNATPAWRTPHPHNECQHNPWRTPAWWIPPQHDHWSIKMCASHFFFILQLSDLNFYFYLGQSVRPLSTTHSKHQHNRHATDTSRNSSKNSDMTDSSTNNAHMTSSKWGSTMDTKMSTRPGAYILYTKICLFFVILFVLLGASSAQKAEEGQAYV